jgi:hypothetical protein
METNIQQIKEALLANFVTNNTKPYQTPNLNVFSGYVTAHSHNGMKQRKFSLFTSAASSCE